MKKHELRCWPEPFAAIRSGQKTAEFRRNDRNFNVGDHLYLLEFDPEKAGLLVHPGAYTSQVECVEVTHIVHGPDFGVPEGYVVMSIRLIEHPFMSAVMRSKVIPIL